MHTVLLNSLSMIRHVFVIIYSYMCNLKLYIGMH